MKKPRTRRRWTRCAKRSIPLPSTGRGGRGEGGNLLDCPDTYMEKIATGAVGKGVVDLNKTPTENLRALAEAKRCRVEDLTVIILSRPRHEALIKEVRQAGARLRLIGDGDVSAAIATTKPETGIDLLLGIGR